MNTPTLHVDICIIANTNIDNSQIVKALGVSLENWDGGLKIFCGRSTSPTHPSVPLQDK